jgi:FkbM family methyltransferase
MNIDKNTEKSLVVRVMRRLRRLILGDRRLLPGYLADAMWHVESMRSRIRGGELVVRFDNLDADVCLDARSDLAARALGEGVYEPELVNLLPEVVGEKDVINVGANVGVIAIVIRRAMTAGSRLLCVEPMPECIERLQRNLEAAAVDQGVLIERAFATDQAISSQTMWTVPGRPEYSSGGKLVHSSVCSAEHVTIGVPTIRLDEAIASHGLQPSAIVMDCEGGELAALRGATAVLARYKPTIVLEFVSQLLEANGGSAAGLLAFLREQGYQCLTCEENPEEVTADFSGTVVAVPVGRAECVSRAINSAFTRTGSATA